MLPSPSRSHPEPLGRGAKRIAGPGRREAQQLCKPVPVVRVFDDALLQHLAELAPERRVALAVRRGQLFEHIERAPGQRFPHRFEFRIPLQQFPRDVQRQIGRIDHTLDEAQVQRQELFGVIHDENALDIQLEAFMDQARAYKRERAGSR